ncbi:MAG: NGG1p interacting factor NIF3 [Bacteriovoracaceae bacterium]|nr:NGG1p interacting factor NIF3 [Bacteriovoracaceae bacterium]
MYQIVVFIPIVDKEKVKEAMFLAGAGKVGNYDCASFECVGKGQFRPLEGSNPHIGQVGRPETVDEIRLELTCQEQYIDDVIKAMKKSHPYEQPAYSVVKTESF